MHGCHVLSGLFCTKVQSLSKFCTVELCAIQMLVVLQWLYMWKWETSSGFVQSQLDGGTKDLISAAVMT